VGGDVYVATFMDVEVQKTVSKIETVIHKLRDLHLQSLFAVTRYCLAPMFLHWIQHAYPDHIREHARTVDAAIATPLPSAWARRRSETRLHQQGCGCLRGCLAGLSDHWKIWPQLPS